jgi:hypothetical protein
VLKIITLAIKGLSLLMLGWCHIIVLNVHAPTEDKVNDVKDSFYEDLGHVFDKFPKYHIKVLLGISMPK